MIVDSLFFFLQCNAIWKLDCGFTAILTLIIGLPLTSTGRQLCMREEIEIKNDVVDSWISSALIIGLAESKLR